jgi:hypothetical protein
MVGMAEGVILSAFWAAFVCRVIYIPLFFILCACEDTVHN